MKFHCITIIRFPGDLRTERSFIHPYKKRVLILFKALILLISILAKWGQALVFSLVESLRIFNAGIFSSTMLNKSLQFLIKVYKLSNKSVPEVTTAEL